MKFNFKTLVDASVSHAGQESGSLQSTTTNTVANRPSVLLNESHLNVSGNVPPQRSPIHPIIAPPHTVPSILQRNARGPSSSMDYSSRVSSQTLDPVFFH